MSNDLVVPDDLAHLPGAPFSEAEVDAAVADVRGATDWHIAPTKTETVTLDVVCRESRLRLPTRKLLAVTAIRDADTDAVIAASLYRVSLNLGQVMRKSGYWPAGFGRVEVDMSHGYDACPADLYAVVAEAAALARRGQSIRSVQIDDFQQQFGSTTPTADLMGVDATLARYALAGDPLQFGIA